MKTIDARLRGGTAAAICGTQRCVSREFRGCPIEEAQPPSLPLLSRDLES